MTKKIRDEEIKTHSAYLEALKRYHCKPELVTERTHSGYIGYYAEIGGAGVNSEETKNGDIIEIKVRSKNGYYSKYPEIILAAIKLAKELGMSVNEPMCRDPVMNLMIDNRNGGKEVSFNYPQIEGNNEKGYHKIPMTFNRLWNYIDTMKGLDESIQEQIRKKESKIERELRKSFLTKMKK